MSEKKAPTLRLDEAPQWRQLGLEDLDEVLEIEQLSFTLPWSRLSYQQELGQNPLAHFYGLFWQERLVAFAGFWLIMDEAHIANVAVHPLFRGQGLGELLMRRLMCAAYGEGALMMTLEVRESNAPALALYEKLGFTSFGKRPGYYGDTGEAAEIMWTQIHKTEVNDE